MRCVNHQTFMTLPAGTLYAQGVQWAFDDIQVKHENVGEFDWYYQMLNWVDAHDSGEAIDRLDGMLERGESYPMEMAVTRAGEYKFDETYVFLIYERDDLRALREIIDTATALPIDIDGTIAQAALAKPADGC